MTVMKLYEIVEIGWYANTEHYREKRTPRGLYIRKKKADKLAREWNERYRYDFEDADGCGRGGISFLTQERYVEL